VDAEEPIKGLFFIYDHLSAWHCQSENKLYPNFLGSLRSGILTGFTSKNAGNCSSANNFYLGAAWPHGNKLG